MTLLATVSVSWANGGPVDSNDPTAAGSVSPRAVDDVRLVSEKLSVTLGDDLESYEVQASYRLHNAGPARTVEFGVPVVWKVDGGTDRVPEQLARRIRLSVGGQPVPCAVVPAEDPRQWDSGVMMSEWCVARIALPAGPVALEMAYDAELIHGAWQSNKSPEISYEDSVLDYPFSPAGYWAGTVDSLDVSVALGPWKDRVSPQTSSWLTVAGAQASFHGQSVDLRKLERLKLVLVPKTHEEREQKTLAAPEAMDASSVLPPQGQNRYEPQRLLDGDLSTAWCEGAEGVGVGEWVELTFDSGELCHLAGLRVVAGYAKSERAWTNNGRVRRVWVAPCGGDRREMGQSLGFSVPAAPPAAPVERAVWTWEPEPSYRSEPPPPTLQSVLEQDGCMRVEIVEVEPGKRHADTCLSELEPLVRCDWQ